MVLQIIQNEYLESYCEKCYKQYEIITYKWCTQCQRNDLKNNFINWTSGNDKIDDFIQDKQLKIINPLNIVFEWIPYNKFDEIKEISKNDLFTMHSAIWKDGPLRFKEYKWMRESNENVALKCIYNSQNNPHVFLNEV